MKKVLFTATVDSHILLFHLPYLKYFKEQGFEVHVATGGDEEIPYCDKKIKISFERNPFKLKNIKAIRQLKQILEEEKYDIIHTHTPMGSVITRLAAKETRRKNNTKVIYTAHGFHFYKGAPLFNWIIYYPIEKYLSKYTDILITINKEDYEVVNKKFKTQVRYIHGIGLDESRFSKELTKQEKLDLRNSLSIKEKDFVMIYPAELSKRKNQTWLINILAGVLHKNENMHILLPGKDSMNQFHKNLIKTKKLDKQIHLLGFRKDIPSLISISDVAISTSRQEGLPVNIMEAMYCGLPLIATDCRGNRDLIKNDENGYLIAQKDDKNFIDAVEDIYYKKIDVIKLGENSKKEVKQYSLEVVMNEMINIYNEIMG